MAAVEGKEMYTAYPMFAALATEGRGAPMGRPTGQGGDWQQVIHVLRTIVALINTAPPAAPEDRLADLQSLRDFIRTRVITEIEPPTESDLDSVRALRPRLRAVFVAPEEVGRVDVTNRLLASAQIAPRLTDHDGLGVHLHYFPPYAPLAEHLLADCSMALAAVLTMGEADRLRVCAAPDCARVLVDSSKNRSRAFCDSGKCANRVNAAAYRARKKDRELRG